MKLITTSQAANKIGVTSQTIRNWIDEGYLKAKKVGNENIVYIFGSTSKITFPGAGVAVMGASKENVEDLKKYLGISIISYDKMNQLRHVKFFGTFKNMCDHMKNYLPVVSGVLLT